MKITENQERNLSGLTATMLVVATMIGTGIFTTTGFMVKDLGSPTAILTCWVLGGILALCGALSFAELAVLMPRNGGEYNLLTNIYGKPTGFVAGWISFIAGFGASIASSAMAFGAYLHPIIPIDPKFSAFILIISMCLIHSIKTEFGAKFQDFFTILKIILIAIFIVGGFLFGKHIGWQGSNDTTKALLSPAFATSLIFVSFAYSGWESAAYIAGEIKNPAKLLPISLISGTLIVTLLYFGLNLTYLFNVPEAQLSGVVEVGQVTAKYLFGESGSLVMAGIIAFGLISSVGSMTMAGPRIYQTMGEDYPKLGFLSKKSKSGTPVNAIMLQTVVSVLMLMTSSFDTLLKYIGFTLSLSAGLAVLGVIILRFRLPDEPRFYKTWGYPVTPILFLALSLFMIVYSIIDDPYVCLTGFGTIISGLIIYWFSKN